MPHRISRTHAPAPQQIARAEKNANPEWREEAVATIKEVAIRQDHLTAFDIRKELEAKPVHTHDLRAIGAVLLIARKLGYIERLGYERRSDQNNVTALWKSCLRDRNPLKK